MKNYRGSVGKNSIYLILLLVFFVVIAFSLGSATKDQEIKPSVINPIAQLEQELEDLRDELRIPGMSAAISVGDKIVWSKGFGWANKEEKVPVTTSSIFHLASLTKPYASIVLLQLMQEGKLDLNSPVSEFGVKLESQDTVMVWHLLSHTSSGKPGTKFKYDGNRFAQLEKVIEHVTGNSFSVELKKRILSPLDLQETAPNPLDTIAFQQSGADQFLIRNYFVTEYARKWGRFIWPSGLYGPLIPIDYPEYFGTAAGLVATASDVARFSGALDQGKLLGEETYQLSMTPVKTTSGDLIPFGLGWFIESYSGQKILWQYGHWFGSSSLIVKVPEEKLSFVILANSDGLSRRTRIGDKAKISASPLYENVLKHIILAGSSQWD